MKAINWCLENWECLVGAAVALLSLINAATRHYDSAHGVRRLLLFAIDALSALRSRGSSVGEGTPRGLSALKMPLVQLSPTQDRVSRRIEEIKEARRG
jgi:hypothetical protein